MSTNPPVDPKEDKPPTAVDAVDRAVGWIGWWMMTLAIIFIGASLLGCVMFAAMGCCGFALWPIYSKHAGQ